MVDYLLSPIITCQLTKRYSSLALPAAQWPADCRHLISEQRRLRDTRYTKDETTKVDYILYKQDKRKLQHFSWPKKQIAKKCLDTWLGGKASARCFTISLERREGDDVGEGGMKLLLSMQKGMFEQWTHNSHNSLEREFSGGWVPSGWTERALGGVMALCISDRSSRILSRS